MFNWMLFLLFVGYLLSLVIGFLTEKDRKQINNLKYKQYRPYLRALLLLIFITSTTILILLLDRVPIATYLLIANILFILYFLIFMRKKSRCWKQHRIIFYNFFVIPVIYIASLVFDNQVLLLTFLIYAYTIFEFQFAEFDISKKSLWD